MGKEYVLIVIAVPVLFEYGGDFVHGIVVIEGLRMRDILVVGYTSVFRHFLVDGGHEEVSLITVAYV